MPEISPSLVSLLLLVLSSYCNLVSCIESEAQALLAWRSSLKNPGNLTEMWSDQLSSDPCRWDGIECNNAGSITSIFYCGFGPFISCNQVDGPPIDGTLSKFNFSSFPNLTEFVFQNNNLHGEIPEEIGSLHNLNMLDLGNNSFTGAFPTAILNLSNIWHLFLPNNKFTGVIPAEISKLSKIFELDLSDNNFNGEIPASIGNMSRLSLLCLDYNYFTGTIPREIGHLDELSILVLSRNRLTGHIPVEIGNITRLIFIDFSDNELQGEVPPFKCRGILVYFYASNNNFDKLLPITLQNCTNLELLDLGNNNIKANISCIFDNLPKLRDLDLSRNCFYGSLPSSLDGINTPQLEGINLDSNNLTGAIPSGFLKLPYLTILILSNNEFSSLPKIHAYNLNKLSSLHLNNNKLDGGFPLLAGNWTSLVTLDLGENYFVGEIPSWIGYSLPILKILRLRSNRFNGTIPSSLSKLHGLQLLDLSNNNLSGPIPHIFSGMSSMAVKGNSNKSYIDLDQLYNETIGVVWKGDGATFQSTIDLLIGIDLSCNSLSGEIPEDLVKLQGLVFLNMSRNHLSSVIPYWIGNLTSLEILDLSMNHLSGTIPPSISRLTHLDTLNLSHNKFNGQIPLGSQIQTFNPSAFSDNDGLCGIPLPNNCSTPSTLSILNNNRGDHKFEVIWITCATILGFIIGFWVYFGVLFFRDSLRFAIFHFVDGLQDKIMKWCAC